MAIEYLKNVPVLDGLKTAQLNLIQPHCTEKTVQKGKAVIHQDDRSVDLYIILNGAVSVSRTSEDGKEVVLDTLGEGDFFGELSLVDGKPRSATVTAAENVRLIMLSRDSFIGIIRKHPDIAVNLLSGISKRLRRANETIETLAFLDVSGRTAKFLLDEARERGSAQKDGSVRFLCPTHHNIACRIGASREAVTKALKALAKNGLIRASGKEIVINPKQFSVP